MQFTTKNTNTLMHDIYPAINANGIREESRNGQVLRFPGHTTVTITNPRQRVNFSPSRDANPFFHLIESLAMLAGHNSVKLLAHFAKNMANFSDDGKTFNAFYGTRARAPELATDIDQLFWVVYNLRKNPNSRQEVVCLMNPRDLCRDTRDKACNLCMIFTINQQTGAVDMSTFNRSNDMVWGYVSGANIVHFSYFQEFVAAALGKQVGEWHHTSANMHLYLNEQAEKIMEALPSEVDTYDLYETEWPEFEATQPLLFNPGIGTADKFLTEARGLCLHMEYAIRNGEMLNVDDFVTNRWLRDTVIPVFDAFQVRKLDGDKDDMTQYLNQIQSPDWELACAKWVARRNK